MTKLTRFRSRSLVGVTSSTIPPLPTTFSGALVYVVGLFVLWIIVSIPVYFAGKLVTGGRSDFGDAMGSTLGGGLAYFLVHYGVVLFLGAVLGPSAYPFALVLGLVVWLAIFRAAFRTGWIGAFGVVVVAYIILLVLDFLMISAFGVKFPNFFPF